MEREKTISVKKIIVHITEPKNPTPRPYGPFINEEVAAGYLKAKGWTKIGDGVYVDDPKDLKQTAVIREILEHPENIPDMNKKKVVVSGEDTSLKKVVSIR
jgi:hypothetical protein